MYGGVPNCFVVTFVAVVLLLAEGGDGKEGSVRSVKDSTDDVSFRSWVEVRWDAGETNDYRRGHKGFVDVMCVTAADGERCYRSHLPELGNYELLHQNNIRLIKSVRP